jgi:hypothetical protein
MPTTCTDYDFLQIEPHWQKVWADTAAFRTPAVDPAKPKYYVLDMFPYPSGAGLHLGHCENYTITDVLARYHRAQGKNVLYPIGWDAFGLPTENYAVKTGRHPREVTVENVATFRRQLKAIGVSYDFEREVDTTDPLYFRWTQWIWLQLFKKGLAYVDDLTPEEMREHRGTLTQPGRASPFRARSPEENLDLFRRMKAGEFADEGGAISRSLRACPTTEQTIGASSIRQRQGPASRCTGVLKLK